LPLGWSFIQCSDLSNYPMVSLLFLYLLCAQLLLTWLLPAASSYCQLPITQLPVSQLPSFTVTQFNCCLLPSCCLPSCQFHSCCFCCCCWQLRHKRLRYFTVVAYAVAQLPFFVLFLLLHFLSYFYLYHDHRITTNLSFVLELLVHL